jgi:hypothetical protein
MIAYLCRAIRHHLRLCHRRLLAIRARAGVTTNSAAKTQESRPSTRAASWCELPDVSEASAVRDLNGG